MSSDTDPVVPTAGKTDPAGGAAGVEETTPSKLIVVADAPVAKERKGGQNRHGTCHETYRQNRSSNL